MTATDELRAMLDERDVNWDYGITGAATTKFSANGVDLTFMPMRDGLVCTTILTPAQAIEATLGRGKCHVKAAEKIGDLFGFSLSCGHSMVNPFNDHPDYCPWCGRKVVDE